MKIIGLTGYARSGKDTVARMLREEIALIDVDTMGVEVIAFAQPLKDFCREVFGFSDEQLHGSARDAPDPRWTRPDGTPLTARYALQTLGTEWGRGCDPNVWVKSGLRRAASSSADVVVFTDVRFLNEAQQIRKAGGEIWRILRGTQQHQHSSEAHIWSAEMSALVDRAILNEGALYSLRVQVNYSLRRLLAGVL